MQDALEVIKFMCKEFWIAAFKKQVDNLRTNHRVRGKWGHGALICTAIQIIGRCYPPHYMDTI